MNLPARLLEEIIWATAAAAQPHARDRERREAPRLALTAPIFVRPIREDPADPPVEAHLRDISTIGIGLVGPLAIDIGERIVVTLPRRGGNTVALECIVSRCQPAETGLFAIGATFSRPIQPA